jgi:allantoicase
MQTSKGEFMRRFSDPSFQACEARFFDEGFWKDVWEEAETEKVDDVADVLIKMLVREKKKRGGMKIATALASLKIATLCIIHDVIQKEEKEE